jgi:hypothetical protein
MKGKLEESGALLISRKGEFKETLCPYDKTEDIACGDWCPLLSEPITRKTTVELGLCHRVYVFQEFEDLRT